jgi:hypothetical protein
MSSLRKMNSLFKVSSVKSKPSKAGSQAALRSLILIIALSLLVVSFAHAVAIPGAENVMPIGIRTPSSFLAQENPTAVVTALGTALNAHNVEAGVALFTDNAVVRDPSNIACLLGPSNVRCEPLEIEAYYSTPAQIRGWLQLLSQENIEVEGAGVSQSSGNNVTWTWQVSVNEYRRLDVAPLVGTGEAIVQGNKIEYLKFFLNTDSERKLQDAFASARKSPYSVAAGGFAVGVVALGLVFPGVAVYYVSRVKKLFATVPRLDKPWILLGGGVGSLFVSVLLAALRDVAGLPASIVDPLFDLTLAVCALFVMLSMILMKRVMISEPDE